MPFPAQPRAVVTGAGSGLGRAFSLELASRRARVLVSDVDLAAAEETARLVREAGGEALVRRCDVAQPDEVEALAVAADEAWGGADLVINNAGVAVGGQLGKIPLEDWRWILGVNLWGVIHGCHSFVPRFRARGAGHIINVGSVAGLVSSGDMVAYNVTKSAVVALSESLYVDLEGSGVGVTVLCPYFFKTNIARAARSHSDLGSPDEVEALMKGKVQAGEVARYALESAERGDLYSLPHGDARWMWRLKRAVPETFQTRIVPEVMKRIAKRRR